jgi:hypothetical protein
MKATNIIYWVTTAIVALMMTYSAYAYFTQPAITAAFHHLGYPNHFRIELGIAKLAGVILLLAPVGARLKEWTYAGFTFTFIAAFVAHSAAGDPAAYRATPLVMLCVLAVSYLQYHKLQRGAQKAALARG